MPLSHQLLARGACEAYNCGATLRTLFSFQVPDSQKFAFRDWVSTTLDADHLYFAIETLDGTSIYRVRLDGTGAIEPLAAQEFNVGQIAVHGDSIYWTESVTLGSVKSCPKSGCVGEPRLIMTALNRPSGLVVDDNSVYVMEPCGPSYQQPSFHDRILRCPVSGCTEPTILAQDVGVMSDLVLDENNLYFAGSSGCGCVDAHGVNHCAPPYAAYIPVDYYIAVIPK